jgi:regulator of sirC expression with transglutaminase-like and TPR domain
MPIQARQKVTIHSTRQALSVLCFVYTLLVSSPALGAVQAKQAEPQRAVSQALQSGDFLAAKLVLDRIIGPSIDVGAVEKDVARLIAAARKFAGPRASEGAKFDAVRKTLYEPGPWNGNRPFAYDQSDPFGQNIRNKLLSVYLKTRRGNCVSMPILFMVVGRGIGLNLTLTTAPLHVLVRYTHPKLPPMNIEATSGGGFARDAWYRQKTPMSDRAIESGLYLRTHTNRQTVAVMAHTVSGIFGERRAKRRGHCGR